MTRVLPTREIKKTWCHEHLVWECGWISGLELEPPEPKCCHNEATKKGPLCRDHKKEHPEIPAGNGDPYPAVLMVDGHNAGLL